MCVTLDRLISDLLIPSNLTIYIEPEHIMIKQNAPGPGTYAPAISINKVGKYVLSTVP